MIRTLHLVDCDRCPDSQFTPFDGRTAAKARKAAKDNGWTREHGSRWFDVCPACTAKTKGGAL